MFITAHLLAGLIIGKITNNYTPALIGALAVDLDHLIVLVRHKVLFNFKKFWNTATNKHEIKDDFRNYFHSVFTWLIVSIAAFAYDSSFGLALSLGYLSHLAIDLLDKSDFYPFYPIRWNVKGPIGYFTKSELYFSLALLMLFVWM